MRDDNAKRRPLDPELPVELARCESILAGMQLPSSRTQRDELMYRAGWAASEVNAQSVDTPTVVVRKNTTPGADARSTLAWSVVSAVAAASLTLAVTVRTDVPVETPSDPQARGGGQGRVATAADAPQTASQPAMALPVSAQSEMGTLVVWSASLLQLRDRALRQQWDSPWTMAEVSGRDSPGSDVPGSPPTTSQEMLREFLLPPSVPESTNDKRLPTLPRWLRGTGRLRGTT